MEKLTLEIADSYTLEEAINSPHKLYLFGDNLTRTGTGPSSGQAVVRPAPNTYGIATKRKPTNEPDAFFSDCQEDFEAVKADISGIQGAIAGGNYTHIVIPKQGFGTGRAKLPEKAPKIFNALNSMLYKALSIVAILPEAPTSEAKESDNEKISAQEENSEENAAVAIEIRCEDEQEDLEEMSELDDDEPLNDNAQLASAQTLQADDDDGYHIFISKEDADAEAFLAQPESHMLETVLDLSKEVQMRIAASDKLPTAVALRLVPTSYLVHKALMENNCLEKEVKLKAFEHMKNFERVYDLSIFGPMLNDCGQNSTESIKP